MTDKLTPPQAADIRQELITLVLHELHGPAGGDTEELPAGEDVQDRYLVGMLAPRKQRTGIDPGQQDDIFSAGDEAPEDGATEQSVLHTPTMSPSSLGLTCCIDGTATSLAVTATWGRYQRIQSADQHNPKTGAPSTVWKRQPMGSTTTIPLHEGTIASWHPEPDEQPDIIVRGIIRRRDTTWIVSLFLINNQTEAKRNKDASYIFQPALHLQSPDGAAIFRRRLPVSADHIRGDAEERAGAMRYRQYVEFAIGHGISVHTERDPSDPTHATRISTAVVPQHELPITTFPAPADTPALTGIILDMKTLADMPAESLASALAPLTTAYAAWISDQRERLTTESSLAPYYDDALATLADCETALARIQEGCNLLATNPQAAKAFAFMNRAMWLQRIHTLAAEHTRNQHPVVWDSIDVPAHRSWRLFQLAFIVLNVPALTNLHHPDRHAEPTARADLLWFPTGGGKTEAYLGLTAYTLAIRRLQGTVGGRSGMDGVAVLMRYTLRLLTLQQFQRAATLLCACEVIRHEALAAGDTRWGHTPFRVGLWVGERTTPNTMTQSKEALNRDHGHAPRSSIVGGSGTPRQLTHCPWCGAPIEAKHLIVDTATRRTLIYCGDPQGDCPFSAAQAPRDGLPVLVVDEDIYHHLPALLIATVDKFAQLPWNGATQMLFGQVQSYCERHGFQTADMHACSSGHRANRQAGLPAAKVVPCRPLRPPDLIIQDELHLISGPLGTMVGLYESVVDRLASWDVAGTRVRPKVIASTATVRRAATHVHALFLRQVAIFPPPGLDARDNFFAVQHAPTADAPGRLYLGICAPGRRQKAVLIRVYVAFLAAAQTLAETYGTHADPWMTLVGYFNTMRELGGMRRLVDDDVRSRLGHIDRHGLSKRPHPPRLEELTSRKGAADIPRILAMLGIPFDPDLDHERAEAKKQGTSTIPYPLDVLLATSMISVGVDVPRLGLMVVSGQPKTTAEYIQATSRVGRNTPGLVCTIFNWARPRDLSHYEQFEHYHATFYQHVEALSVTPFSARALDRGLSALLVSYVRLLGTEFNANDHAGRITEPHALVDAALADLPARAALVTGHPDDADAVREQLMYRIRLWLSEAHRPTSGRILSYKRAGERSVGLLKKPEEQDWDTFTCLNSLRDVEPMVTLMMTTGPLGSEPEQTYRPFAGDHADDEEEGGDEEHTRD